MTDLVQADVIEHHVAHQRIVTDAAPDARPEAVLVRPHDDRGAAIARGRPSGSIRPSAASSAQGNQAKRSSAASVAFDSFESQRPVSAALPLLERPDRQLASPALNRERSAPSAMKYGIAPRASSGTSLNRSSGPASAAVDASAMASAHNRNAPGLLRAPIGGPSFTTFFLERVKPCNVGSSTPPAGCPRSTTVWKRRSDIDRQELSRGPGASSTAPAESPTKRAGHGGAAACRLHFTAGGYSLDEHNYTRIHSHRGARHLLPRRRHNGPITRIRERRAGLTARST